MCRTQALHLALVFAALWPRGKTANRHSCKSIVPQHSCRIVAFAPEDPSHLHCPKLALTQDLPPLQSRLPVEVTWVSWPKLCFRQLKSLPGPLGPDLAYCQELTSCTASLTPWMESASWVRRWRIRLLWEASFPPLSNKPLPVAMAKAATCRSKGGVVGQRDSVMNWQHVTITEHSVKHFIGPDLFNPYNIPVN